MMQQKKIMTFTKPGTRLQLLRIFDNTYSYYQIRKNRRIIEAFLNIESAVKYFGNMVINEAYQETINYDGIESIQAPND